MGHLFVSCPFDAISSSVTFAQETHTDKASSISSSIQEIKNGEKKFELQDRKDAVAKKIVEKSRVFYWKLFFLKKTGRTFLILYI